MSQNKEALFVLKLDVGLKKDKTIVFRHSDRAAAVAKRFCKHNSFSVEAFNLLVDILEEKREEALMMAKYKRKPQKLNIPPTKVITFSPEKQYTNIDQLSTQRGEEIDNIEFEVSNGSKMHYRGMDKNHRANSKSERHFNSEYIKNSKSFFNTESNIYQPIDSSRRSKNRINSFAEESSYKVYYKGITGEKKKRALSSDSTKRKIQLERSHLKQKPSINKKSLQIVACSKYGSLPVEDRLISYGRASVEKKKAIKQSIYNTPSSEATFHPTTNVK